MQYIKPTYTNKIQAIKIRINMFFVAHIIPRWFDETLKLTKKLGWTYPVPLARCVPSYFAGLFCLGLLANTSKTLSSAIRTWSPNLLQGL